MSLLKANEKLRPILIVGKSGTGKTKKALTYFSVPPIIQYANEYDIDNNFSLPRNRGILIEEVNFMTNKLKQINLIVESILQYRGQIILTSLNQKDVPKKIFNKCKLVRAGSTPYAQENIIKLAPRANEPKEYKLDIYTLLLEYLKNSDRDEVASLFKLNTPSDIQLLSWIAENVNLNKIAFIDSEVKRRWPQSYFYEMLAYSHNGKNSNRINMPKRRKYTSIPSICYKLKMKPKEYYLLDLYFQDDNFKQYAKTQLNNAQCRLLKLGEKRIKSKIDPIIPEVGLSRWL
jgi:hypothetical protein